jgi:hypothetical protein
MKNRKLKLLKIYFVFAAFVSIFISLIFDFFLSLLYGLIFFGFYEDNEELLFLFVLKLKNARGTKFLSLFS